MKILFYLLGLLFMLCVELKSLEINQIDELHQIDKPINVGEYILHKLKNDEFFLAFKRFKSYFLETVLKSFEPEVRLQILESIKRGEFSFIELEDGTQVFEIKINSEYLLNTHINIQELLKKRTEQNIFLIDAVLKEICSGIAANNMPCLAVHFALSNNSYKNKSTEEYILQLLQGYLIICDILEQNEEDIYDYVINMPAESDAYRTWFVSFLQGGFESALSEYKKVHNIQLSSMVCHTPTFSNPLVNIGLQICLQDVMSAFKSPQISIEKSHLQDVIIKAFGRESNIRSVTMTQVLESGLPYTNILKSSTEFPILDETFLDAYRQTTRALFQFLIKYIDNSIKDALVAVGENAYLKSTFPKFITEIRNYTIHFMMQFIKNNKSHENVDFIKKWIGEIEEDDIKDALAAIDDKDANLQSMLPKFIAEIHNYTIHFMEFVLNNTSDNTVDFIKKWIKESDVMSAINNIMLKEKHPLYDGIFTLNTESKFQELMVDIMYSASMLQKIRKIDSLSTEGKCLCDHQGEGKFTVKDRYNRKNVLGNIVLKEYPNLSVTNSTDAFPDSGATYLIKDKRKDQDTTVLSESCFRILTTQATATQYEHQKVVNKITLLLETRRKSKSKHLDEIKMDFQRRLDVVDRANASTTSPEELDSISKVTILTEVSTPNDKELSDDESENTEKNIDDLDSSLFKEDSTYDIISFPFSF